MTIPRSALILLLLVPPLTLRAGDTQRSITAFRCDTPPIIDGHPGDNVWYLAQPATGFLLRDPDEGEPASETTEIRILYDDEALYFSCRFYDSEPSKIVSRLTRRDNVIESDRASIYIDSYHDHQTAYEFSFNAAGVKVDVLHYDDGNKNDVSWDEVWYLETRILPDGWCAELKIPFRVLRYRSGENGMEEEWGINFVRYISRKQETARWAFTPKKESGFVSRFGHLAGLVNLPHPGQFEVAPFVVARQRYEPARPVQNRIARAAGDAGMDIKYSLSRSFTLDATINPDFGQVEADPAVLNLTTFETFYPEKRPFFVEGTQILRFTTFGGDLGPGMFYSRRIGRGISASEARARSGEKVEDLPQSTTILGAAKVNGKTTGGLSVGVLQGVTEEEETVIRDTNGVQRSQVLEPLAHYNVVRLKQDIFNNSNVGVIVTSVAKRNRYPAITNGYDWYINLDRNTYLFEGFFAHTHASDQLRQRIRGSAGRFNLSRVAAEHWLWGIGARYASRRYDINDAGFFFRPDGYTGLALLVYKEDKPGPVIRNYSVSLGLTEFHNMADVSLQRETRVSADVLFVNYWRVNASASLDAGEYDDRETRGNGLYDRPQTYTAGVTIYSDARNDVNGRIGQRFGWDSKQKWQYATDIGVTIRPLSWMEWQAESQYEIVRMQEAWVTNTPYPEGVASIFGDRDTDQLNFTLRGNITFTRDLTLQLYTQLFLAKGHYENFRRLVGTSDFGPAVSEDRDFNRQSFNSNIVLRWEYLPGSTMFLVWSQARRGEDSEYFTSVRDDFDQTFRIAPANVVLLKVSYRMSL